MSQSDTAIEKERDELSAWLSALQPDRRHVDVNGKRSEGTGAWFLNAQTFMAWYTFGNTPTFQTLMSLGAPGAGKTILW